MSEVVESTGKAPVKMEIGVKLRGAEKVARIPVKIIPTDEFPRKPVLDSRTHSDLSRGRPDQTAAAQTQVAQRL